MSFRDCVQRGVDGGGLDPARAERILSDHDQLFKEFQNTMGSTQADYHAARHLIDKTKREAAEKRRVMQLQAAATQENLRRMEKYRGKITGKRSPSAFVRDLIAPEKGADGSSVSGKIDVVRRSFRRELTDAVREFSANIVGNRRNQDTLRNVTREIFGEATDDPKAKAIAQAWGRVSERARTRFNAAGGHIGKREDWGLPQMHDSRKVAREGYNAWREFILPKLDLEAMGRDFNDGIPFTPETLEILLKDAHDAIRTDGYSRRSPAAKHGSAMYNRRADHRFFKFKDAKSWTDYNDRFGSGADTFRVMLGHLDRMATDIGMMETLGPNPTNAYQFLKDAAQDMTARDPEIADFRRATSSNLFLADALFDDLTGVTQAPGNERIAKAMSSIRAFNVASMLGSAVISSITDFNTQRVTAKLAGMGKQGFGYTAQIGRLMTSKEFRDEANRAGLIFENAVDVGNAANRYHLEDMHVEAAARLSDAVLRTSGLSPLTEVQRQAFGMEFMSEVAGRWRQLSYDQLDPRTRDMMRGYGITGTDWEVIRSAPIHDARGLPIVRPQEIEELGDPRLADRYMEMIASLTEHAVPSASKLGRAAVTGSTRPGTFAGEFLRTGLQFKSFPITAMLKLSINTMSEVRAGRYGSAAKYMAGTLVGGTVLGALAIQMKEVIKGKDPRDATTPEFWQAALLQGGGMGIFGDFLFADQNRFGGGLGQTLAGPSVQLIDDVVLKFGVGNIQELAAGEDTGAGRELTNLMRRYTPGGSLWYTRLAYERLIIDELQMAMDPKHRDSFRARTRRAEDYGTQYFAPPGRGLSGARAPDLSNAFGG